MSFEKFSNNKNGDSSHEHGRPQELIDLEWNVAKRYAEIKLIPSDQFAEFLNKNGVAIREIVDKNTEFSGEFMSAQDPDIEKLDSLLEEYGKKEIQE